MDALFKDELLRDNAYALQCKRFEVFKEQDLENGHFDVTFEVEGKKLYAHKIILTCASDTLNAWLTDRWTTKDQPVKIESYTFGSFCQFLCFVYSGDCLITAENVREHVDMAEFFGTQLLKTLCDEFLSENGKLNMENIEEMLEFADKYSLKKFEMSIDNFMCFKFDALFERQSFLNRTKIFVKKMAAFKSEKDSEEDFFEAVYKWAEGQAENKAAMGDGDFDVQEAIISELTDILPFFKFYKMNFYFLINCVVENGILLSPNELLKFFLKLRKKSEVEDTTFKIVYELAEQQAKQKQKISSDSDNFDLAETIKTDLAEVIPLVQFYRMDKNFIKFFVVAKGVLSEKQACNILDTRVVITNQGKSVMGVFKDDIGIRRAFKNKISCDKGRAAGSKFLRFSSSKFPIPKAPSTVKKMKGVHWYLCLEKDGILTFEHHTMVDRSDYLIAEMKSETEFQYDSERMTDIEFFNNF